MRLKNKNAYAIMIIEKYKGEVKWKKKRMKRRKLN
jgi:hypothetical protein